ncbi:MULTISPECIES: nucleotide-binding protein [Azotobacter]|uniref:Chromosome partitioning protein n=2 Tax=Azotobacter TaxID=352 RepID=A0A1H6WM25_9GAMM|nr:MULTISPECIES: AAA family ATPase [Azotobacter]OHC12780.1 MAG: chromosome partitioning protein ParA [Pseudomonadales bacterium GWC1_66_9]ASL29113.1 ParA family protein [Azotobacter chroococcum]QQE91294.1 AAA family ATPase [Azotobacter chroococcum]SEJ15227.1 chromosome partitioning protein [Azotobacter beijerinckii]SER32363.1 chromosome partitioning protein [Azotobacter beijerinckii]
MILVLGGEKGGSGKSCLAQNLAVWLQRQGHDVLLVDADPQGTSLDWAREREQNPDLPDLRIETAQGDIRKTLLDRIKRYEKIVVDAGGADSVALRSALTVATHALFPFRPKRRDLKTLAHAEEMITLARSVNPGLIARSVITQAPSLPSQVKRILDSKDACTSYGFEPLQSFTTARNVYDDADEAGSSVLEAGTDAKAVEEIEQIAAELWGTE